jgi:translocation and assembly module TamA
VPAWAADPLAYTVTIAKTGNAPLDAALAAASTLTSLRTKAPVSPFGLVSRARLDQGRFKTALESEGYYDGATSVTIDGFLLADPLLPEKLGALPKGHPVKVAVTVAPGPLFTIGAVSLGGSVPEQARRAFHLAAGQPARAADVLAAGAAMLKALQNGGYAMADVPPPQAIEYPDRRQIDIAFVVATGPRLDLGPITFTGLRTVNARYVRRQLTIHQGELYRLDQVEAARQALASLPVFKTVQAIPAKAPDAAGQLPLTFSFVEAYRYVVALNGAYSTDLGASLGASWTDRDVFGAGQRLVFSAAATELGGSDAQEPGYDVEAHYTIPNWLRRDQTLAFDAIAVRQYLDTYDRTAITLDAIATRQLSKSLSVSAGISGTEERVTQESATTNYSFVGLPLGLTYDTTHNLLEPTHGVRASATVTPTYSYGGTTGSAPYVLVQGTASTYVNLARPGRSILALRFTLGASEGAGTLSLPPDQRFYAGGSATLRGYKYQYASPEFPDGVPEGGTSLEAGTVELRQRFGAHYGIALFADGGQVGTTGIPFDGRFLIGAGAGVRYYTPFGPIRLDVAVPLVDQPHAGSLQAYIGLGEAF